MEQCDFYDVGCGLGWLSDELQLLFVWMYYKVISGFAVIYESIPVPDFLLTSGTIAFPAEIAWFAMAFELDRGVAIIASAYVARFIVRRLPVVG